MLSFILACAGVSVDDSEPTPATCEVACAWVYGDCDTPASGDFSEDGCREECEAWPDQGEQFASCLSEFMGKAALGLMTTEEACEAAIRSRDEDYNWVCGILPCDPNTSDDETCTPYP